MNGLSSLLIMNVLRMNNTKKKKTKRNGETYENLSNRAVELRTDRLRAGVVGLLKVHLNFDQRRKLTRNTRFPTCGNDAFRDAVGHS